MLVSSVIYYVSITDDDAPEPSSNSKREPESPQPMVATQSEQSGGLEVRVATMDVEESMERSQTAVVLGNIGEYDWLVKHFQHLHDV